MSKCRLTTRDRYLRKTYGITQAIYITMLNKGSGMCWICKKLPKPGKNLHVDHDHKTKQVRGLLCWLCNKKLIGRAKLADVWKYEAAAKYLASTKDWRQV